MASFCAGEVERLGHGKRLPQQVTLGNRARGSCVYHETLKRSNDTHSSEVMEIWEYGRGRTKNGCGCALDHAQRQEIEETPNRTKV